MSVVKVVCTLAETELCCDGVELLYGDGPTIGEKRDNEVADDEECCVLVVEEPVTDDKDGALLVEEDDCDCPLVVDVGNGKEDQSVCRVVSMDVPLYSSGPLLEEAPIAMLGDLDTDVLVELEVGVILGDRADIAVLLVECNNGALLVLAILKLPLAVVVRPLYPPAGVAKPLNLCTANATSPPGKGAVLSTIPKSVHAAFARLIAWQEVTALHSSRHASRLA
ncbi:hypothetical protein LTR62_002046 [Meristemomyces frigidus]|uniref:Uncharacterized protein n=1 Tax=Meristemomyces frigidus TaxID=1508187 RepID=A0AAN7YSC7_9PEZI|nr:hypothetical protein LTR62_002046 [Meristemomyces frigidus]